MHNYLYKNIKTMISGKVFNETYPNEKLCKLTRKGDLHREQQYVDGLNVFNGQFNSIDHDNLRAPWRYEFTTGEKGETMDGMYFCFTEDKRYHMMYCDDKSAKYENLWDVTIPDDAQVVVSRKCWNIKTDKMILSNKRNLLTRSIYEEVAMCQGGIKKIPHEFVDKEMFYVACKANWKNLKFVPIQLKTQELYKLVVKYDGFGLKAIPEQVVTHQMRVDGMKNNGDALQFIPHGLRTKELCEIAISNSPSAISYVPLEHLTEAMCETVVKRDDNSWEHIPYKMKQHLIQTDKIMWKNRHINKQFE